MKLPLLLIVTSLACLGRSASSSDDGEGDLLMLNVHSTNATTKILDTILSCSLKYLDVLLQAEPQYLGLGPGQAIPDEPDRALRGEEDGASRLRQRNRGTAAAAAAPLSHGPRTEPRSLLFVSCPLTCAKSSSSSCKQLGCAYCGTTCRRRRERGRNLLLSGAEAAWIEGAINLLLSPLCARKKGCSIYSKIVRVRYVNGTVVAVPLV